jgi:hypothetical protein
MCSFEPTVPKPPLPPVDDQSPPRNVLGVGIGSNQHINARVPSPIFQPVGEVKAVLVWQIRPMLKDDDYPWALVLAEKDNHHQLPPNTQNPKSQAKIKIHTYYKAPQELNFSLKIT